MNLADETQVDDRPAVLVLDDEEYILYLVNLVLGQRGFRVSVSADGQEGLRLLGETRFAVALVDLLMPGMSGRQFIAAVGQLAPELRPNILVVSALRRELVERELVGLSYFALVAKPFDLSEITEQVAGAAAAWREQRP